MMEVAYCFKALVKLISEINNEEIMEPGFLSDDFIRSSQEVLDIRRIIIDQRWNSFIDTCYKKMMSSPEMYLTFIMYPFMSVHECNENVFDSFIDVYAVLTNMLSVLSMKTGVDFCPLINDIFNLFYVKELQADFCKNGGTRRLVEYIRHHRLLRGKRRKKSGYSSMNIDAKKRYLKKKIEKEYGKDRVIEKVTYPEEAEHHEKSCFLAKAVLLLAASAQYPILTSYIDVITRLVALGKKKAKEIAGEEDTESSAKPEVLNVNLKVCSSSISDYKNDDYEENQDNIERYEKIIQSVIRHNQSKGAANANTKDPIQEEVDVILKQLIDTFKSLVEILEEHKVVSNENK